MITTKTDVKQGTICINEDDVLFIVTMKETQPIHWDQQVAAEVYVGTCLLDGRPILCTHPRVVAQDFKTYLNNVATDMGIRHAEQIVGEKKH